MKPVPDGDAKKCPQCRSPLYPKKGLLEQTPPTVLPTTVWECSGEYCEYKHWEPAQHATWDTSDVKDPITGERCWPPRNKLLDGKS